MPDPDNLEKALLSLGMVVKECAQGHPASEKPGLAPECQSRQRGGRKLGGSLLWHWLVRVKTVFRHGVGLRARAFQPQDRGFPSLLQRLVGECCEVQISRHTAHRQQCSGKLAAL